MMDNSEDRSGWGGYCDSCQERLLGDEILICHTCSDRIDTEQRARETAPELFADHD